MIALFTAADSLINLVSVCTLSTFTIVAAGVLWRHYYLPGTNKPYLATGIVGWNLVCSIGAPSIRVLGSTAAP